MTYLDTHVVAWLYAGELERFPVRCRNILESESLVISPIVLLELQYLQEIGRITAAPTLILQTLQADLGLSICQQNFERIILESLNQSWTRDPFDRLIVAQAAVAVMPLITKDITILRHYPVAIWE